MSQTTTAKSQAWWKAPKDDKHQAVFVAVQNACRDLASQRSNDKHFAQMYGLSDFVVPGAYRRTSPGSAPARNVGSDLNKFKFNIGRSVVDTAASAIASKRPKVKFQTDDANWSLVRKAQACEQAVKGIFAANRAYELGRDMFVDASVTSLGALFVYSEHGQVRIERAFPGEVVVDPEEGYYGEPRTVHRIKFVDRCVLEETFERTIEGGKSFDESGDLFDVFGRAAATTSDRVMVVESWRLGPLKTPDKGKGKPYHAGRHTICTSAETLLDEEYRRPRFPFAFFRFAKRQVGFYGQGLIERLRGYQQALNYVNLKIADMMHRNSRSNVMLPAGKDGQQVSVNHITNDPTTIIHIPFGAGEPRQLVANGVPPELFQYQQQIIELAYAEIGFSMMTATGQVPKGLDSGQAIREAEDVGSRRFQVVVQAYEQTFVDLARIVVDELREMDEDAEPIRVTTSKGSRARVQLIKFREVDLDDDNLMLDVTPASSLPDSSAGRTATVTDWLAAGLIDKQEAKALLDHPDLERFKSLDLASYEVILDTIESIVEDGEYHPPEPTDDLVLAKKLVTQSYNKFRMRGVDRDRLDLLLEYLDDVIALEGMAMQATPQAAPAPAGMVPPMPQPAAVPPPMAA